nr:MAG TPA: hypothetical protein [Caudoviricetes sp.]
MIFDLRSDKHPDVWMLYFPMIYIRSITKERNGTVVRCRKACKPSMVGQRYMQG